MIGKVRFYLFWCLVVFPDSLFSPLQSSRFSLLNWSYAQDDESESAPTSEGRSASNWWRSILGRIFPRPQDNPYFLSHSEHSCRPEKKEMTMNRKFRVWNTVPGICLFVGLAKTSSGWMCRRRSFVWSNRCSLSWKEQNFLRDCLVLCVGGGVCVCAGAL